MDNKVRSEEAEEKMTKILEYLEKNPNATNHELVQKTGLNENYIKVTISRLKARGKIKSESIDGIRTIKILDDCKREDLLYLEDVSIITLLKLVELNEKETIAEDIRANAKLIYQYIQLIRRT